jgi:hypothetical protein
MFYFSNQTQELADTAQELEEGLEHYWSPYHFWVCRTAQLQVRNRRERYVLSDESMADLMSDADLIDQLEDLDLKAVALYGAGWMLQLHGDLDAAKDYLHEGLTLAERTGNMVHQTWLLTWLSVLYRQRDEREACHRYALRGLETATIAGLAENAALVRGNLAWLSWCGGDDAEAEAQGRRALELWQRSPFVYAFHWTARLPLLALSLDRNRVSDALEHARAMLDPLQQKLPDPLGAALEAAVQAGEAEQPAQASVHLRRAVQVAQETGFL